ADCKATAADLHAAQDCLARSKRNRRPDPAAQCWVSSARESFLRTFRQARRAYYDRKIQDIASVGDISAFSRWRTRPFQTTLPPLLAPDGTVAESIEEKQELLFDSFSATAPGQTDDTTTPPSYPSTLPFPAINPHEVEAACLNVSSTTPGREGVPVSLLELAWTLVGKRVHSLSSACRWIAYRPQPFRTGRVGVIPKPGKRDRS